MYRYFAIAGPVIFFISSVLVGCFTQDYDYQSQMISELGATGTKLATEFNYSGFLPNGILIMLLGFGLIRPYQQSSLSLVVPILIIIHGLGMILATWISCDISCNPKNPSHQQVAHNIIAAIKFSALHLAILISTIQFFKLDDKKTAFALFSLFMISGLFMALFVSSLESRYLTGLYQRMAIFCIYTGVVLTIFRST